MQSTSKSIIGNEYLVHYHKILGKGSTGIVYGGTQLTSGEAVAIKIIDLCTIENQVTEYLYRMEKTALMMLNNKHVLKGLFMCESKRECFMITEYCNGGTLKALIRESSGLGEARTLDIVRGILTGYGCLLEHGVVHRDLKPANIMLHENQPKIIDFGYCQIQGFDKPEMEYNVGSPSYMAPESYKYSVYDEKTEIWAIGVIMYECLFARTLDEGRQMKDTFEQIQYHGITYPKSTSKEVKQLLEWCLTTDPKCRPTHQQFLAEVNKIQSKKSIQMQVKEKMFKLKLEPTRSKVINENNSIPTLKKLQPEPSVYFNRPFPSFSEHQTPKKSAIYKQQTDRAPTQRNITIQPFKKQRVTFHQHQVMRESVILPKYKTSSLYFNPPLTPKGTFHPVLPTRKQPIARTIKKINLVTNNFC